MINRRIVWLAVVGVLVLATSSGSRAQESPTHFNGLINDHTFASAGGWELHGVWTLDLKGHSGKGDFAGVLTMERSDLWFLTTTPAPNPNSTSDRHAHTHHIAISDGDVSEITGGFRLTGDAFVTANGATFASASPMQLDLTGGDAVSPSNITIRFTGPALTDVAAMHFGSQPLNGVVSRRK